MPGQKLGHDDRSWEIFVCFINRGQILMKLGSKTRSTGQYLGNSCLLSRGQICDLNVMKLGQNVCLDNISRPSLNMGHV